MTTGTQELRYFIRKLRILDRIDSSRLPGLARESGKSGVRVKTLQRGLVPEADHVLDYLVMQYQSYSFARSQCFAIFRSMVYKMHSNVDTLRRLFAFLIII